MGYWQRFLAYWYQTEFRILKDQLKGQEIVGTSLAPYGAINLDILSKQFRLEYLATRLHKLTGKEPEIF